MDNIEKKENKRGDKKRSLVMEIVEMIIYFIIVIGISTFIVTFVGQRTVVIGSSMESTLSDGNHLIVDKVTYRFSTPERFDIIVFPYQWEEDTYYIKRIIGMPGETVQIIDEDIFINGELLEEDYGREEILYAGRASEAITLEDDEYFVMGDNRNYSADSREEEVGNIKREDIVGRAWVRIYPFNKIGVLKHQ